ncbi:MAG TPA: TetR family transcriptional regulator [Phnomibacter sp.]|nr:TetR family transcriptional regulator [Phnomibacter sp.]
MELSDKQIHIIEVAESLFAQHGYGSTSIRDISKEANVNLAMVSYYFGSKEKLLEAIFHYRIFHSWFLVREAMEKNELNTWELVEVMIDSFVDRLNDKANFHALMIRQQLLGERSPMYDMLMESKCKNYEMVCQLVKQGQDKGIFKENVDIALMIVTMVGTGYQLMHSISFYSKMAKVDYAPDGKLTPELMVRLKEHLKQILKSILIK